MKTMYYLCMMLFLCSSSLSSSVVIKNYAEEKEASIKTDNTVYDDDYLFLGNELNFSGKSEDLIFLGKHLTFDGTTKLGLTAVGEHLIINGTTGNGIMAAAVNTVVNGPIHGNNYFAGKSINISEKSTIDGYVFMAGATLSIDGIVNGNVYAAAGQVLLNGTVNGDVKVYGGRITFGDKAHVNGNLIYGSKEKIDERAKSKITGTITHDKKLSCEMDNSAFNKTIKSIGAFFKVILFISFVLLGSLILLLPSFRYLDNKQTSQQFWNTFVWGIIPLLMYPAIIILCFVMIFSIPLGVMLILGLLPLFFFTYITGATLIGKQLVSVFKWNIVKRHYQFLIGAAALCIISIIPVLDFLSFLFVTACGLGVFVKFLFDKKTSL
ncbi:MAG: polymer-forming cytoskeletal protein [Fibrobacter sp.]|nr:polymer-forming cytoskeletal protein [Fibrobacter sp.]